MKNLRIWSLLCLIWMGVLAASAQDTGKEKISLGDAMPAITLSSEIYGKVTPADLKGKVVLVSLFATWCGPCQIELAEVQKTLWPKYKDNKDFKLLVPSCPFPGCSRQRIYIAGTPGSGSERF